MLCGVEEHGGADTELAIALAKHRIVHAALAAFPEGLVVRQVGKGDGLVAQCSVHLHHGSTAGQREYLGMWPTGKPLVVTYC